MHSLYTSCQQSFVKFTCRGGRFWWGGGGAALGVCGGGVDVEIPHGGSSKTYVIQYQGLLS